MTAKENADELVEKCKDELIECDAYFLEIGSKNMALIIVNEILKTIISTQNNFGASETYWQQVKQEIEKR